MPDSVLPTTIRVATAGKLPVRRASRIRFSWFVLGTAFGIAAAYGVPRIAQDASETAASPAANETAESKNSSLESRPGESGDASAAPVILSREGGVLISPNAVDTKEISTFIAKDEDKPAVAQAQPQPASQKLAEAQNNAAPALPATLKLRVGNGDTLIELLTDTGVAYDEAAEAVRSIGKVYDPKKLNVGQHVAVDLTAEQDDPDQPVIASLSLPLSDVASLYLTRREQGGFAVKKIESPLKTTQVKSIATIRSSLYQTGAEAGIPSSLLAEMIKAYSYDVDFQRDIKPGNQLEVLFERKQTDKGTAAGYGNLIYASLKLADRTVKIYRYTDKNGNTDYYNEKGESLKKALLRTPINGARISSGFGMRMHPIMGYSKMHRGVDFAAASGTPIYAAGDGVVEFASVKGGYGNYLKLKHNDKYATAYGHLSRFAQGIKPGVKVRQGQVVAYVGSTGQSTGPHLHYEVLIADTQVNPAGIKFKTGNTLSGKELAAFKGTMQTVQASLKAAPDANLRVAMAKEDDKKEASN